MLAMSSITVKLINNFLEISNVLSNVSRLCSYYTSAINSFT